MGRGGEGCEWALNDTCPHPDRRMVGASGRAAALVGAHVSFRFGLHDNGDAIKIIVFLSNVGFEIVLMLKEKISAPAPTVGRAALDE